MERSSEPEILDAMDIAEDVRDRCYDDLARTHRWLGNHAAILKRLRHDPCPVTKVLDIGCGHGALLREIHTQLGIEAVGIDLNPPKHPLSVQILRADAIHEPLPPADIAISVVMAHHLSAGELIAMIRNVGLTCRRFIILDLVRHPLPLALFRLFVAPFVNPINVHDGIRSLERSFTPEEIKQIVTEALDGTPAQFRHSVAPLFLRQIVDIVWPRPSG